MINRLLWLLLAAAIFRLWLMPLPSGFWVDEMGTAYVVRHGASDPSFAAAPQVPDSLYYWLPRASVRLFGNSEFAYRLPGVFVMAVALWLAGDLAARWIDPAARWFAVFACLALGGIDYYAVDARPYGLAILVAAAAMWFLTRWLDSAGWLDALGFAVCASMLWRVHLLAWPMYLVFAAYAASRARASVGWLRCVLVFGAVAVCLAPVAWHARALEQTASAHVFAAPPGWRDFSHLVRWNLVAICAFGGWLAGRRSKLVLDRRSAFAVIAWWLAPPVFLFAFSRITGESVFVTRYVSVALPGAALAATLAASIFLPSRLWKPVAGLLGAGALLLLGNWGSLWPAHEHSGWREAAAFVNRVATPGTPVICPSPFVEARPPFWKPGYQLPGFLYSHLDYYPVAGAIIPFPFQALPASMPKAGNMLIYGPRGGVAPIADWYGRNGWRVGRRAFGDVWVVRLQSNSGSRIAL